MPPQSRWSGKLFFKITRKRSLIGMPETIRKTALGLGLTKRLKTVYRPATPTTAGAILKIKELVDVSTSTEPKNPLDLRYERKTSTGFTVKQIGVQGPELRPNLQSQLGK